MNHLYGYEITNTMIRNTHRLIAISKNRHQLTVTQTMNIPYWDYQRWSGPCCWVSGQPGTVTVPRRWISNRNKIRTTTWASRSFRSFCLRIIKLHGNFTPHHLLSYDPYSSANYIYGCDLMQNSLLTSCKLKLTSCKLVSLCKFSKAQFYLSLWMQNLILY